MFFDEKLAIRMKNLLLSDLSIEMAEMLIELRKINALLDLVLIELKKQNERG